MCRHAPRDKNTTVAVYECAAHRRRRRLRLLTVNDTVGTKKKAPPFGGAYGDQPTRSTSHGRASWAWLILLHKPYNVRISYFSIFAALCQAFPLNTSSHFFNFLFFCD